MEQGAGGEEKSKAASLEAAQNTNEYARLGMCLQAGDPCSTTSLKTAQERIKQMEAQVATGEAAPTAAPALAMLDAPTDPAEGKEEL